MTNDLTNIPAAACKVCGGWTSFGGMSQHADAVEPVLGRTGCTGPHMNIGNERIKAQLTEASKEALTAAIKKAVASNNAAMVECLDLLILDEEVYALGHTSDGHFATWQVNTRDHSSFWGHYMFMTRDDARRDLFKRAGLKLGSLDQLI